MGDKGISRVGGGWKGGQWEEGAIGSQHSWGGTGSKERIEARWGSDEREGIGRREQFEVNTWGGTGSKERIETMGDRIGWREI